MGDFKMCPECEKEYTGKLDRRRHAQTIACKDCGPKLSFEQVAGVEKAKDTFDKAVDVIATGGILAVDIICAVIPLMRRRWHPLDY